MSDNKITIVIVDDDAGVLKALTLMVSVAVNAQLHPFQDARKALIWLEENHTATDYILSDLRMPEMSGTAFFEQCHLRWPELKFILMSGHADQYDASEALNKGMYAFLGKPFSADEVQALIL